MHATVTFRQGAPPIIQQQARPLPVPLSLPLGVTPIIRPPGDSPPGCLDTRLGAFGFEPISESTTAAQPICFGPGSLIMTLDNGVLLDLFGRVGTISSTRQFRFYGAQPQEGAIFTGGFSICPDNLLALGARNVFYACPCANSSASNIYDTKITDDCEPVFLAAQGFKHCS
ncbi:hypothetical protein HOY82DRAFT_527037 [Tuber indicum]|nr:hypothetical protein HOY82DRAFT_527037 [Tuber indicum]